MKKAAWFYHGNTGFFLVAVSSAEVRFASISWAEMQNGPRFPLVEHFYSRGEKRLGLVDKNVGPLFSIGRLMLVPIEHHSGGGATVPNAVSCRAVARSVAIFARPIKWTRIWPFLTPVPL